MNDLNIIVNFVAEQYGITPEQLKKNSRRRDFLEPRQVAHWLAKTKTDHTLAFISAYIGNKDHATILYSVKKVKERRSVDRSFRKRTDKIQMDYEKYLIGSLEEETYEDHIEKRLKIQREQYEAKLKRIRSMADELLIEIIEGI